MYSKAQVPAIAINISNSLSAYLMIRLLILFLMAFVLPVNLCILSLQIPLIRYGIAAATIIVNGTVLAVNSISTVDALTNLLMYLP